MPEIAPGTASSPTAGGPTEATIELASVSKDYVLDEVPVNALADVSFKIYPGSVTAVIGRSGSGKSTLLNILGGLDRPTRGEVIVAGKALARCSSGELAQYRRETVGFIFQSFYLIPHLSALENVALPLALANVGLGERRRRAAELLANVGLTPRAKHRPAQLSGGERQRVAIARALANDPRVLLADEPTGNLDSRTALEILELIARTGDDRKRTVVLVTHDREQAEHYSGRVIELVDGRVVRDGPSVKVAVASAPTAAPTASAAQGGSPS